MAFGKLPNKKKRKLAKHNPRWLDNALVFRRHYHRRGRAKEEIKSKKRKKYAIFGL